MYVFSQSLLEFIVVVCDVLLLSANSHIFILEGRHMETYGQELSSRPIVDSQQIERIEPNVDSYHQLHPQPQVSTSAWVVLALFSLLC